MVFLKMREINSKILIPEIRKLLTYATSKSKISEEYINYIQTNQSRLFVWELDGEIVGCIGIESINKRHCKIKHIAVSANKRKAGIGSKMINNIIEQNKITILSAETDNDAVGFYKKCGFTITSLGEKYPGVERFECLLKK